MPPQAHQKQQEKEMTSRQLTLTSVQQSLMAVESRWHGLVDSFHQRRDKTAATVDLLVRQCRSLTAEYQAEFHRVATHAEAAAQMRHLRLHLISDAEIPRIGASRKQILASNNIRTAADIEQKKITGISGFGDVLTNNLLAWRGEVVARFRFDPARDIPPAEQRLIVVTFRNRQQQVLAELGRQSETLESLGSNCKTGLDKLTPELTQALALFHQADADLQLMKRNR